MDRNKIEYTLYDAITPQTVSSSTDATPIVITTAGNHGFVTGQAVIIYGHTTNIAANGIYKITVLSPTTFSLQDYNTGANIVGSGAGAGSGGVLLPAPKVIYTGDFKSIELQVDTSGTATLALGVAISEGRTQKNKALGDDTPNFGATIGPSNPWSFVQLVNLASGGSVSAVSGIAASGTDIDTRYEVNTNATKYLSIIPLSWTQGIITVKLIGYYF